MMDGLDLSRQGRKAKREAVVARKSKPSAKPKRRQGEAAVEDNGVDVTAWLRGLGGDGRLPQGVPPAEKRAAVEALAELHGVGPVEDPRRMAAPFWPAGESADEIVSAIRELRRKGK
jgi:hypothetical protein